MVTGLREAGFRGRSPQGAYYVRADFSALSEATDTSFAMQLAPQAMVAAVPGGGFFSGNRSVPDPLRLLQGCGYATQGR